MDSRIPLILQPMLKVLSAQLTSQLFGKCTALYVVGSIALADFVPDQSDVDLVAVLDSPASPDDDITIRSIHAGIEKRYPNWKCEAMYFQQTDLGSRSEQIQPFPRYLLGKLTRMEHFPLSAVTWWTLKQHGLTLFGPPAQALTYLLDLDDLLRGQRQNLNTYWASWTTHPIRLLKLLSNWGVQWTVLGVLRQLYTLREHRITSKTGAGQYALQTLPTRYHPIIREALTLRTGSSQSSYSSRLPRASAAFHLLRRAIDLGNQES